MESAILSTKGQLVIPLRFRRALHLKAGDKVTLTLEGEKLTLRRQSSPGARLIERHGRKVLQAPPDAPPMTSEVVRSLLADFP